MNTPTLIKRRVTLYFSGEMFGNIHKVEASSYFVAVSGYAQYSSAVHIFYVPKGSRNIRGTVQTSHPSLLILDGWNHPEPAPMMGPSQDLGAVSVSRSTYSAFDGGWATDFAKLIAGSASSILHDFRAWNSHTPFIGPLVATPAERYAADLAEMNLREISERAHAVAAEMSAAGELA